MNTFKDLKEVAAVGQLLHNILIKSRPDLEKSGIEYGCSLYVWGCQVKVNYTFKFDSVLFPDKQESFSADMYYNKWIFTTTYGEPLSLISAFYEVLKPYENETD